MSRVRIRGAKHIPILLMGGRRMLQYAAESTDYSLQFLIHLYLFYETLYMKNVKHTVSISLK